MIGIMMVMSWMGCATLSTKAPSESSFEEVNRIDSIQAYEAFLQRCPEGKYARRAKERIEELYYIEARISSTIPAYKDFIKKFPDSQFAPQAKVYLTLLEALEVDPSLRYENLDIGMKEGLEFKGKKIKISFRNKTGISVKMLFLGKNTFSLNLIPDEDRLVLLTGSTTIVFTDDKKTFAPERYYISIEEKVKQVELWLSDGGEHQKRIKILTVEN
jgi:predicted ester cyclase